MDDKNWRALGSYLRDDRSVALDRLGFSSQLIFNTFHNGYLNGLEHGADKVEEGARKVKDKARELEPKVRDGAKELKKRLRKIFE